MATGIVAGILTVQFAVPLGVFLLRDGDFVGRFGWQMYATSPQATRYTVHTDIGSDEVTASRFMAVPRADLPLENLLPPHLCRVVDGAIRVTWESGELEC